MVTDFRFQISESLTYRAREPSSDGHFFTSSNCPMLLFGLKSASVCVDVSGNGTSTQGDQRQTNVKRQPQSRTGRAANRTKFKKRTMPCTNKTSKRMQRDAVRDETRGMRSGQCNREREKKTNHESNKQATGKVRVAGRHTEWRRRERPPALPPPLCCARSPSLMGVLMPARRC